MTKVCARRGGNTALSNSAHKTDQRYSSFPLRTNDSDCHAEWVRGIPYLGKYGLSRAHDSPWNAGGGLIADFPFGSQARIWGP